MRTSRPVIALLTDFGLTDYYVAAMKGVVLGVCPDAALIDITHDIAPQDVLGGALELEAVAPYLPDGTVVLAVVDPGVGTSRRAVAVDTGRLRLVGPDNGLFSTLLDACGTFSAVELSNPKYHRAVLSRTFEGRDRFAPVAAHIACGVPLEELGPPASDLVRHAVPYAEELEGLVHGEVLRADRFGNLVTNIQRGVLDRIGGTLVVEVAGEVLELHATYGEADAGTLICLVGSTDRLEIAVSGGSAVARLRLGRGTPVSVRRR